MVSERNQIAERFRSEGAGEAAKIMGKKEKDLQEIESEAYKTVQRFSGAATQMHPQFMQKLTIKAWMPLVFTASSRHWKRIKTF